MNSIESSSSSIGMSVPPPPPPPPAPISNANGIENGRSQLLTDIRRGATLKKSPNNGLSQSDKLKKQTQDLLQAELTSTLKRRKSVVINEPPKYEYPIYNDNANNNTNVANKNNESSSSHSKSGNTNTTNVTKPLNANTILSVVSSIKIPDVQYDAKSTKTSKTQSNDKSKITHGKPNFSINTKENKPINGESTSPKTQTVSTEISEKKLHRPSFYTNTINPNTVYKSSAKPIADPNSAESQVEKCKSIFLIKTQKSVDDNPKTPQKLRQKIDLISKFENIPTEKGANVTTTIVEKTIDQQLSKKKSSIDETTNGISFDSVVNKKALFEKPVQNEPISATLTLNRTFNTLNSRRNINHAKPGVTTVNLNKNTSFGTLGRSVGTAKDQVDHFERTVHTHNEIKSTNGKFETKQFEHKTIVSFSKDLCSAPNKYPEQIRVKKTIVTERSHAAIHDNPFQNIRFSIQSDGDVIPKAK